LAILAAMRSGLAALIEINAERRLAIIGGTRARIGGGRSRPSLAKRLESRLPAPRLWGYPACRSLCTSAPTADTAFRGLLPKMPRKTVTSMSP